MIKTRSLKHINIELLLPTVLYQIIINKGFFQIMFTANDSGKHNVCFKAKGENLEISDLFQIELTKRKGIMFLSLKMRSK